MIQWKPYLISLAVGLLVGIERENSKADKALGVRTFLLLSLLGAITGSLPELGLKALISLFAFGLIITSYVIQIFSQSAQVHLGLTTEFAAGLVFTIGVIAHTSPLLAATLGPVIAIILFSKDSLHQFTRQIKPTELKAAISILLIAVIVIELTPDQTIDPWGFINPRKFGYLLLILATLEFSSYLLFKIIGERKGALATGFLGGLVSSTAVLISSTQQALKSPELLRTSLSTVMAAQIASLTEMLIIILVVSQELFLELLPPVASSLLFCATCLFFLWQNQPAQNTALILKSPLDLKGVLRLSLLFGFLLILVSVVKSWLGLDAIYALSFVAGLFELQGISLANANLFGQKQVLVEVASQSILIAVVASFLAKIGISWFINRNRFSVYLTLLFVPIIAILFLIEWVRS